ncbi:ribosome hibernation-promoting factor, HPF/YfiA family [Pyruvatibacter mobilis]|jgi:ribosomal subunit interface protein|uniref:Ribosome hibernation promoting factor n=2 Tax=Alphaproteobacteria TaxID=28211 RepID=A0A845Q8B5_9HYPH|nr:ribosome-associated translation inhibitor RaiA [Pyruvatibacter mobilis]NBG94893.1 ribosome-associated translation inhibitor RaiA [Pyruvatibacter mobilis]QJD76110.1 ribosome-associated translation inhibitor RaiA [Pyruvatibacter mobilis]GGD21247.1 ribosomal subunit interface protein [Pyruvatibacter mobilis]
MQVQVTGKHIDVGDALRVHVTDRLEAAAEKYLGRAIDAHVVFSKEGHEFQADCTLRLGHGVVMQSQARAGEIYSAFDGAADRMEKRLRRHKRRLKDHHAEGRPAPEEIELPARVLSGGEDEAETDTASDNTGNDDQPVIIAETTKTLHRLSVGEAVMRMDLADAPFLLFKSGSNDAVSMVYRREDGNIGWVELGGQG